MTNISNEFAATKTYKNRPHLYRFWLSQGIENTAYAVAQNAEGRYFAIFPQPKPAPEAKPEKKAYIYTSSIEKPCETVRRIADEMYEADAAVTRMQIINACIEAGVATGTARKQYNDWRNKRGL